MASRCQLRSVNRHSRMDRQPFVPYTNKKIETTSTPDSLCCALQGLTNAQKADITNMGFESIKSFSIHNIPTGLGYWLLVNYDHKRSELNVGDRVIEITPSKVHDVLGVPTGTIAVFEKRKPRKADAFREEWRNQFNQDKITVKNVSDKLKSYRNGGTLFKLNFLVLFNSVMGETTKRMYPTVNHKFLASIMNEGDISSMDWCSYIITCLKRTKEEWNGTEPYNGPLTFLAVLYAHEQQLKCSPEKAITSAIKYVTTDYLVDLESSMCDNGPCLNDDVEEDNQSTQYVEVQVEMSLSGLSANLSHCNRSEPPKDVILLDDNDDDDVVILDPKQEQCELVEKFPSRRSDTVCVQGYTVKRDVAKILEAIFEKHGDIADKCVIKTKSLRSPILEAVCEVVKWIQVNDVLDKLEDIENRLSDIKALNIDVSWLQTRLDAIRKRKAVSEEYNLLIEMKANALSAKKAAQICLRKRRAELADAQEQSKRAKRCVDVLHLVGANLIDHFFKSEAKMNSWVKDAVV
ncbi:putative phospholipase [Helianthus annuus]|nr:putative phospholipase [Helianthus annuus]KAJ0638780.1 putative phospholipase [Helianthus annuus]KAJ0776044.1 putative phospholipase [Helianthus annuus]